MGLDQSEPHGQENLIHAEMQVFGSVVSYRLPVIRFQGVRRPHDPASPTTDNRQPILAPKLHGEPRSASPPHRGAENSRTSEEICRTPRDPRYDSVDYSRARY
jgi:hypothetical protein